MTRLAEEQPTGEARVERSRKNTFNRSPLLIPQLFADTRPWYRKRANIVKLWLSPFVLVFVGFMLHNGLWLKALKKFAHLYHH